MARRVGQTPPGKSPAVLQPNTRRRQKHGDAADEEHTWPSFHDAQSFEETWSAATRGVDDGDERKPAHQKKNLTDDRKKNWYGQTPSARK